jgi:hypothetical protein
LPALGSCVYSNSDIYLATPVAGDSAVISATTNLDTLLNPTLGDSLMVSYRVEIDKGELYYIESYIEDLPVYERATDYDPDTLEAPFMLADSFWIQGYLPLDPGANSVFIVFYYSANTNSLGDIYGIESNLLEREYVVTVEGGGK